MKKTYAKPVLEVEEFMLNASIAQNCGQIITHGPADPTHLTACDEFLGRDEVDGDSFSPFLLSKSSAASFYTTETGGTCSCYYSAGGEGYYTS